MALIETITEALRGWDRRPVLIARGVSGAESPVTAQTFLEKMDRYCEFFEDVGLGENSPVMLLIENSTDFPIIFFSLIKIGAVPVLAKTSYRTREFSRIFGDFERPAVICDRAYITQIRPWTAGSLVISIEAGNLEVVTKGHSDRIAVSSDVVSINYTYRGCGYPLGAMVSERGYIDAARRYQEYVQFHSGGKVLALLPMSHIFTLVSSVFLPILFGQSTYVLTSINPKIVLNTIEECRINYLSSVPEILAMLARLKTKDRKTDALRVLVSGGSRLTVDDQKTVIERFGVEVLNGYGLTEMAPITANRRNSAKFDTLGEFCRGLSGRIEQVADSDSGEICVDARGTFLGYYGKPEETRDVLGKDGWFKTGDLGRIVDGYVEFCGERKRTRKVNGQIVDLREVEEAFLSIEDVRTARVDGETNLLAAKVGWESPLHEDTRSIVRRLRRELLGRIAEYKIPRTIEIA